MATRIKEKYLAEAVPALQQKFGYKNVMEIPKLDKIVINMGLGDCKDNAKAFEMAINELTTIAGQKPMVTKAKKSIANFKLREEMPIGAKVTLRGDKMWEFLDRLVNLALPRVRDFRGVNPNAFDGRGNYALGIKEQFIFPEIEYDKIDSGESIKRWNAGQLPVGLIHPASAGHGLNLQSGGNCIIWFGITWSLELYQQTNGRLWRQGQNSQTVVINHIITSGTIDERILRVLKGKDATQEELIDAVKANLGG